jgi:hypothetical protein
MEGLDTQLLMGVALAIRARQAVTMKQAVELALVELGELEEALGSKEGIAVRGQEIAFDKAHGRQRFRRFRVTGSLDAMVVTEDVV